MRLTRAYLVLLAVVAAVLVTASWPHAQTLQKVTINYPTRSGASWHLYLAKEGGYYQKHGLDVDLQFGVHPAGVAMLTSGQAVMVNHSLEQGMIAGVRDPNTFTLMGSTSNKGLFALVAQKGVTLKGLKGKRFAVGQIGDAPYNYTVALLGTLGLGSRDVQWIPVGTDVSGRAAALQTNRADATLLTAPAYFRLEEAGFPVLANLADNPSVFLSTVYLFARKATTDNPKLAESLIKAHAEAIKRFYEDKAFAVKAYIVYDKQQQADVERIYDTNFKQNLLERIPYVLAKSVQATKAQADSQQGTQIRNIDLKTVVDNTAIDRLVKEGFFEKLFGPGIKAEIDRKSKMAFR